MRNGAETTQPLGQGGQARPVSQPSQPRPAWPHLHCSAVASLDIARAWTLLEFTHTWTLCSTHNFSQSSDVFSRYWLVNSMLGSWWWSSDGRGLVWIPWFSEYRPQSSSTTKAQIRNLNAIFKLTEKICSVPSVAVNVPLNFELINFPINICMHVNMSMRNIVHVLFSI